MLEDPVDFKRLSPEERTEYSRLKFKPLPTKLTYRALRRSFIATGLYVLVILIGIAIFNFAPESERTTNTLLFAGCIWMLIGTPVPFMLMSPRFNSDVSRIKDEYLQSQQELYLDEIGYASRSRFRSSSRSSSSSMSARQRNHAWYGGHSDLTWRDREVGQALGIDAETYISNIRDHDPD